MIEVDTSSYLRPAALPVQKSPLDIAQQMGSVQQQQQQIQSNALGIDKQKLELVQQRFTNVDRMLAGLRNKPDLSADDIINESKNALKLGLSNPDQHAQWVSEIPSKNAVQRNTGLSGPQLENTYSQVLRNWIDKKHIQAQTTMDALNHAVYGSPVNVGDNQTVTPARQTLVGGPQPVGPPIQMQPPPTTPSVNAQGQPTLLGAVNPQLPPNTLPVQGGFPSQFRPAPQAPQPNQSAAPQSGLPIARDTTPITPNAVKTVPGQIVQAPQMPRGPVTGFAPGVAEAATKTGAASGEQLANARQHASNFQREVFPLEQAIPALEALGTKGTGPGTETINHIKSFVLANVPGVKESDFKGTIKDYDIAKKYLTDFVNQTGNSGTNDKLAAAFAGNPSVGISNAAAIDVAKSALALRRMQQAQILQFEKTGLPDDQFAKWSVQNTNKLDARAFGVDLMKPEAKAKLRAQLDKNPLEKARFEQSLQLAHDSQFITPTGH